jgi:hypothetical protein
MPRLKTKKQSWESRLQSTTTGMRGWSLSEHNGKVRLRLQFPNEGNWPANAQTNLPYTWEPSAETFTAVQGLVTKIYGPVMEGGITLKAAIDDVLAISDHKAQEVVTPWPGIVDAFKDYKLAQGNRIAETTFNSSYGRYLNVALVHLQGRKPAQTGKELTQRVLAHQRTNQKPGVKQGEALTPWIEMPKSRLECCLAIKKFVEFAVTEQHHRKHS